MIVEVYHRDLGKKSYKRTVRVDAPHDDMDEALEFAWRHLASDMKVGDMLKIGDRTFYLEPEGFAEARAQDRD